MKAWLFFLIVGVISGGITPMPAQDWDRADRATRRLAPSAIARLPAEVREEMERRGCTVPQPFPGDDPANIVTGRFTSPDRLDWAVLCSRDRRSSILVFPGGEASGIAELAGEPDVDSLQTIDGNGTIGYSRALAVANAADIREYHKSSGGPPLPPLDHDGIEDVFIEKGSVVWYWSQGTWLTLPGAD